MVPCVARVIDLDSAFIRTILNCRANECDPRMYLLAVFGASSYAPAAESVSMACVRIFTDHIALPDGAAWAVESRSDSSIFKGKILSTTSHEELHYEVRPQSQKRH